MYIKLTMLILKFGPCFRKLTYNIYQHWKVHRFIWQHSSLVLKVFKNMWLWASFANGNWSFIYLFWFKIFQSVRFYWMVILIIMIYLVLTSIDFHFFEFILVLFFWSLWSIKNMVYVWSLVNLFIPISHNASVTVFCSFCM